MTDNEKRRRLLERRIERLHKLITESDNSNKSKKTLVERFKSKNK